jgi:hypothetical protein
MGKLDQLIARLGAMPTAAPRVHAGVTFDPSNAEDVLRRAVVRWKGSPSDLHIHAQDALSGAPVPTSASGERLRAMAEALLHATEARGRPAPVLYRGDRIHPAENPSPLLGWTANRDVAQHWAKVYDGTVYPLEGRRGLNLQEIVGDMFDDGEAEWILQGPFRRHEFP